jgi:hypothetical protein
MIAIAVACGNSGDNGRKQQHRGGFQGHCGSGRTNRDGGRSGNLNNPYKDHQC